MIVRPAISDDITILRSMYHIFLQEREDSKQNYTFLPNTKTVDFMFTALFVPAINDDNGVFVAWDNGIRGALFWVGEQKLPIRTRHRHIYGYGQCTFGSDGDAGSIIDGMISYASRWAKDKGFTRVIDTAPIGHQRAHAAAARNGFKTTTDVLILDL